MSREAEPKRRLGALWWVLSPELASFRESHAGIFQLRGVMEKTSIQYFRLEGCKLKSAKGLTNQIHRRFKAEGGSPLRGRILASPAPGAETEACCTEGCHLGSTSPPLACTV